MSASPPPLSYARPAAADPRLGRWGGVAIGAAILSLLLHLGALAWTGLRFHAARALAGSDASALLYRFPTRLEQPDGVRFAVVCSLLLAALLLAGHLLIIGWRLLRQRPSLAPLRAWARWRIALSLLLPLPAMLLAGNLHAVHEQRVKAADLLDARLLVGGMLIALAWVELVLPVLVLRRIRRDRG
jgi:hypothetical protein